MLQAILLWFREAIGKNPDPNYYVTRLLMALREPNAAGPHLSAAIALFRPRITEPRTGGGQPNLPVYGSLESLLRPILEAIDADDESCACCQSPAAQSSFFAQHHRLPTRLAPTECVQAGGSNAADRRGETTSSESVPSPYLTARQASKYLNVAYGTFRNWAKDIRRTGTGRYTV